MTKENWKKKKQKNENETKKKVSERLDDAKNSTMDQFQIN